VVLLFNFTTLITPRFRMILKVNIDLLLVQRKMTLTELSNKVGVTIANLSKLKCGRAKAIRFSTLLKLCEVLDCKPGDILELDKNT
jgi:putative transcriptional regulator